MKLEQQVCSLELAKKLKELGVKQNGVFFWHDWKDGSASLMEMKTEDLGDAHGQSVSAFTVAELGEILKKSKLDLYAGLNACSVYGEWENTDVGKKRDYLYNDVDYKTTEADSRAKMLVYLLENKLITP